jgi:glycosyltransferase involved in cell wall biosynthesis
MYTVLVNALSVTNPSGLHVLLGHMDQLVDQLQGRCRFAVLCREDMATLRTALGSRVDWKFAPVATRNWLFRSIWERVHLARVARQRGVQAYFTPSGMAAHLPSRIAQIVFCQNPWALVPAARRRRDAVKAWLQRRAYQRAMRVAAVMVFNSRYMQQAYRANAGLDECRGLVVHQAAAEKTRLGALAQASVPRKPGQILSVSVMAPHKNAEALVRAFAVVRKTHPAARLVLAGSWPDSVYERKIRTEVDALGLRGDIHFAGFLAREQLDHLYAESRVFCLMSRCESFGIPAIEAQLFGTPVITSTVCAMPEIGGAGGIFYDPDDVDAIASALRKLLEDDAEWQRLSQLARQNAERFAWNRCSRPLVDLFSELAGSV